MGTTQRQEHESILSIHYDNLTSETRKRARTQLFIKQDGCCAICGQPESELKKRLCIDHCHITGHIRGLLCNRCNFFIGAASDNVNTLRAAIDYLVESRERRHV